jgi:hypothetical protein
MKQNRPHRKVVIKPRLQARPDDLARRYREVCELRRRLQVFSAEVVLAEAASRRPGKIKA